METMLLALLRASCAIFDVDVKNIYRHKPMHTVITPESFGH